MNSQQSGIELLTRLAQQLATARADQHWQLQQAKPKTKEEIKAAEILKSDKLTKELYGFDESDIAAATNR